MSIRLLEQKGEILGRIIGNALVFKCISKIPKLTKYGINNLFKDSGSLLEAFTDGTFSATQVINKVDKKLKAHILQKTGLNSAIEIPKTAIWDEFWKNVKEYKKPYTKGGVIEATVLHAGVEEGFFAENFYYRPEENSSTADYISACGKRMDIKSEMSQVTDNLGKTFNTFDIDRIAIKLGKDLKKGEITLFNGANLKRHHLMEVINKAKEMVTEETRHLIQFCFTQQNIADLAAEGFTLPRMVKDANASPIKFAFYQLDANQIAPMKIFREILKVTPLPELAAVIQGFREVLKDLYTDTVQEKSSSSISKNQLQDIPSSADHSDGEKEAPYTPNIPTDSNTPPNDPPSNRPSNLLLSCLTDIEYDGLTFRKMIEKAKEERFKKMVKYLSNQKNIYTPKTHKEQMELQIQNTQIAYNQVAEQIKEIEFREANLARITVGTSQSLFIAENATRRNLNDMQKRNLWKVAYQAFPEIKKLLDEQIKDVVSTAMKSLGTFVRGSSMVSRIKLLNLQIAGWIGDSFENFKLDIAQCYFDKYGKLKLDADIKTATELTAKFFRSISFDKAQYQNYINQAEKLNHYSLKRCMETELEALQPGKPFQGYYSRQNEEWWNTGLFQYWLNFGYNGIMDRISNHKFNSDLPSVINFCSRGQFLFANSIITTQEDIADQKFLRNIYNYFYSKAYNRDGILKIYENDPFLREKALAKTLAVSKSDITIQDRLNNILALRHLMKERIAEAYNISPIDRPLEVDIILYMLVTFKLSRGDDPLVTFAVDPTYSKIINYFFNKSGEVKTLDGFLKGNEDAFSETIFSKFFSSNSGFVHQFLTTRTVLNRKNIDKTIVTKLLKYLQEAVKSNDNFIKETYIQIYNNIIRLLLEDKVKTVESFGNIMFIDHSFKTQKTANHKTILYLVKCCTECFIRYNEFDGEKYTLLKSLFQKINELFTLNKNFNNLLKVESDLSAILEMFKIDRSIIELPQEVNPIHDFLYKNNDLTDVIEKLK